MLSPNHLKYSGSLVKKWIFQIFNHKNSLEAIPSVLFCSIQKTFQFILLDRILPSLSDINIPFLLIRRVWPVRMQLSPVLKLSQNTSGMVTQFIPVSIIWPLLLTLWNILCSLTVWPSLVSEESLDVRLNSGILASPPK